jgi:hypothetical protein
MEIRVSAGLLVVLLVAAAALSASRPRAVFDPATTEMRALAELEDAASYARGDVRLAQQLATTYLRLGQPGLAIAAVRAVPGDLARDPLLTHRLAQAYEASGRVDDALSTAELARARCAARMSDGLGIGCSAATQAALDMHAEALTMLLRWGVQQPRHDTRTGLAYRLAQRTAHIASLGLVAPAE